MDLSAYYDLISSESNARKYLLVKYFKKPSMGLPSLQQQKIFKILTANSLPITEGKSELWIHHLITLC